MTSENTYVLKGVCGSTAHGLAHADSDEDIHGVFSYPTDRFWNLQKPAESIVENDPDFSAHELEKFLHLASKSNPQVLELLWLENYLELEPYWGKRLIDMRDAFASSNLVFHAYAGYADSQFKKLNEKPQTFEVGSRAFKNAKHMIRLLEQGHALYATGHLPVAVGNRDWYLEVLPTLTLDQLNELFLERMAAFRASAFALPPRPDFDRINEYLYDYRGDH